MSCWVLGSSFRKATTFNRVFLIKRNRVAERKWQNSEFRTQAKGVVTFTSSLEKSVISTWICAIWVLCNVEKVAKTSFTSIQVGTTHFTNRNLPKMLSHLDVAKTNPQKLDDRTSEQRLYRFLDYSTSTYWGLSCAWYCDCLSGILLNYFCGQKD